MLNINTDDGVEEFYSKGELSKISLETRIKLNGFTYTGSSFRVEVKNPALIFIESLQDGDVSILDEEPDMRVGETGTRDFDIFRGNSIVRLSRKSLLRGDCKVSNKNVSDMGRKALISGYLELYPSSYLSMFLKV